MKQLVVVSNPECESEAFSQETKSLFVGTELFVLPNAGIRAVCFAYDKQLSTGCEHFTKEINLRDTVNTSTSTVPM